MKQKGKMQAIQQSKKKDTKVSGSLSIQFFYIVLQKLP